MNQSLTRLGLALALCSGLFLSGCNDDNDNPSTPSSPAPVEPSPTPAPSTAPTPAPPPDDTRPQPGQQVNFLGKLKSVDGTQLKVGSQAVVIDENTTYDRSGTAVALDNFQIGETVRVRGIVMDDRSTVLATRINIPAPATDEDTTP